MSSGDPRKGDCEGNQDNCKVTNCPLFGTLGKPARDGKRRIKGCGDPVARGRRSRRKGLKKQRDARKALGVAPSHKFGDANEERWNDPIFANEVKSGKQIQPAVTAWLRIEKQVRSNEADFGSLRKPCRAVLMPDDWGSEGLVMLRLSVWRDYIAPALAEYYGQRE
jgi:hypothetical protein